MAPKKRAFDLTAHRDPVAGVITVNGVDHDVLKLNGLQYQRVQMLNENSSVSDAYDLVHEVVPSLSKEDLLREFDRDMCSTTLLIAARGIDVVGELFPNALSPEDPTSPG